MKYSLLVDEKELKRFIEWLPDIKWDEAWVVMLLIRSKLLKKKYGFKGTDHTLQLKMVPGYYGEYTKFRLELVIKRLAVLGYYSQELFPYFRYKPGTREVEEIIMVPRQLVSVMIVVNPARWIRASINTLSEFMQTLYEAQQNPDKAQYLVRRIDVRLPANCMRRQKHIFHQIDLDIKNKHVVRMLEDKLYEHLGYIPARVETPNGYHYLVRVSELDKDTAKKWFRDFMQWFNKFREELGEKKVEYKKQAQEPVPGTLYQGDFIVRFTPEKQ